MMLLASIFLASVRLQQVDHDLVGVYESDPKYTKYDYEIPMRDGVKLYTTVYVPKDKPGKHPILMERTPYSAGPYGKNPRILPGGPFEAKGYIFAYQDVRGCSMSGGTFEDIRPFLPAKHAPTATDESTDTSHTVDFLVKNVPDNNGNVGLWGISYPGFYAEAGAVHTNPHLKAVSPQAPVSEWFKGDDWHHNGCLFVQDAFDFMSWFGTVRPKPSPGKEGLPAFNRGTDGAYAFFLKTGALPNIDKLYYKGRIPFWNEVLAHDTFDSFWQDRSVPMHLKDIHCPMLFVGGFFDAEDEYGALHSFAAARAQNKVPVYLCMGPWYHGMWAEGSGNAFGNLSYGSNTGTYFLNHVEFPFFEKYLDNDPGAEPLATATVFETGKNKWEKYSNWPPKVGKPFTLYLDQSRKVVMSKPLDSGASSYVNNPNEPTPYVADLTLDSRPLTYPIDDQSWATKRKDVLTFESAPLRKDVILTGPVKVKIWMSSTGTDADIVAKLIDVYPSDSKQTTPQGKSMANYELMLRGDIMRAKFRKSWSDPEPLTPGKPTLVPFTMNAICHEFKKGHRFMVQIQSDWFPLVDRNPNRFEDINTAQDSDFKPATITIFEGGGHASSIEVNEVPVTEK